MVMPKNGALGDVDLEDGAAVIVNPEDSGDARSRGRDVAAHNDSGGVMQKNTAVQCRRTQPRRDPEECGGGAIQVKMERGSW
jgi:hypothetical protein